MTYKVIVAGGRDFSDYSLLKQTLNFYLHQKIKDGYLIEIVSGVAKGADLLGERYANEYGYPIKRFPANWDKHKLLAGPIRNNDMGNYGDVLVAYWDGKSRGTANMIETAKSKGLKYRIVRYNL
jgi:hypothetical protein